MEQANLPPLPSEWIGGFQGVIESVFRRGVPNFRLRELSTRALIKCEYEEERDYRTVWEALKTLDAVVHVNGIISPGNGMFKYILKMKHIMVAPAAGLDDLNRLFHGE